MRRAFLLMFLAVGVAVMMGPGRAGADITSVPISQQASEQVKEKAVEAEKKEAPSSQPLPFYRPPLRGAPEGRVGGGSRGIGDDLYTLFVFAPDHVGLSGDDRPNLFWFLSRQSVYPMELSISDDRSVQPLLEIRITPPVEPGIHAWKLADHPVRLEPGRVYRWFVSIVPDENHRSRDVLAGGAIRLADEGETGAVGKGLSGEEAARAYAQAGLWYDAIDAVMEISVSSPGDQVGDAERDALLEQVQLPSLGPMR